MSTRDAKGSLSAPSLSEENNFQLDFFKTKRPNKRLREEQEAPQIKVDAPSSSNFEVTEPLHQQPTNNAVIHPKKAEYLKAAFKFCRLREKEGGYVYHRLFLSCCISENIIPNGLRLELEPTIGNHDETFLNNWYEKLQQHSQGFMKDIITFCYKRITKLKVGIENTEKKTENHSREQNI